MIRIEIGKKNRSFITNSSNCYHSSDTTTNWVMNTSSEHYEIRKGTIKISCRGRERRYPNSASTPFGGLDQSPKQRGSNQRGENSGNSRRCRRPHRGKEKKNLREEIQSSGAFIAAWWGVACLWRLLLQLPRRHREWEEQERERESCSPSPTVSFLGLEATPVRGETGWGRWAGLGDPLLTRERYERVF